jgi:hypothetical protein
VIRSALVRVVAPSHLSQWMSRSVFKHLIVAKHQYWPCFPRLLQTPGIWVNTRERAADAGLTLQFSVPSRFSFRGCISPFLYNCSRILPCRTMRPPLCFGPIQACAASATHYLGVVMNQAPSAQHFRCSIKRTAISYPPVRLLIRFIAEFHQ